ncbi:hypothetical protein J7L65_05035 [Candidatus Bathyarchaeota archaeon]|nr:hypothetical protein [Candidatus Bathyarchaeota archaeon]
MVIAMINIPIPLLVLLLGGGVLPLIGLMAERLHVKWLREGWTILIQALALYSVYPLYREVRAAEGRILLKYLPGGAPPLGGCFEIDVLGVYMAGCISLLALLVAIYSTRYMEHEGRLTEFYTLFTLMNAGMVGVAMAGDFFTLFVFWEMMCISSYVLVSFMKHRPGPIEAGFKYFMMSATGSAFLLLSMSLLYGMTGTLNFAYASASLKAVEPTPWLLLLFTTLLIGFGIKSAIVPFHTWLPDAHPEAPGPISAMLSGIVIETGLYALTRVIYLTFPVSIFKPTFAALSVVTMTLANILALLQSDLKRMLAYSSISQIGYMLVGISTGTAYGLMGALLHIFNHSLMKGLAFLCAGSIVHQLGSREISEMRGLGRRMPFTSLSLSIALLGLGGVPTTNGFVSKFILFSSAIGAGMPILAVIGVLNSALSMAYYLRVIITLAARGEASAEEAPAIMVGISLLMALLIVIFGVWPQPVIRYADIASKCLLQGVGRYLSAVMGP